MKYIVKIEKYIALRLPTNILYLRNIKSEVKPCRYFVLHIGFFNILITKDMVEIDPNTQEYISTHVPIHPTLDTNKHTHTHMHTHLHM